MELMRIRYCIVLWLALMSCFVLRAEEKITFEVNTPMIVGVNETFKVEFNLNAKPDDESFTPPSFQDFDVLAGPAVSQGQSIQITNGQMSKQVNYTITYVLLAKSEGDFRIAPASVVVKGDTYRTRETYVEVRAGNSSASSGQSSSRQQISGQEQASSQIGKDDLLYRLVLSRTEVYKGEPIRASLKLYSRVRLAGSEGNKMPSFDGFWSQELQTEQGPFRETFNGKLYETYVIGEYLLYPQRSGKLVIDPAQLTILAQIIVQSSSPFDSFFGGGHEIYNVRRELKTQKVTVHVLDFPSPAPASFNGAVGKYSMDVSLSQNEITANSAANFVVKIAGTGNVSFLSSPTLNLPSSFELYDVKTEDQVHNTISGSTGQKVFEYPFIARTEGEFDIPHVEFTYFSTQTHQYVTLSSNDFHIKVNPDKNSSSELVGLAASTHREDIRLLGQDVRIMLGRTHLKSWSVPFILSASYFVLLLLELIGCVVISLFLRKRIRESRNTALVKGKRANKVAVSRFRLALRYMNEQNRRAFYEEMLKALWGYFSDKFNIPTSLLKKESIREELSRRGVQSISQSVIDIITRCEEAQYSPSETTRMEQAYADGIEIVSRIETILKK